MNFQDFFNEKIKLLTQKGLYQVPGIGLAIYQNGQKQFQYLGGEMPFTEDTLFRIASVSKQFTVFTIMQLVEAGKINLDEDVSNYLKFSLRHPAFPNVPITIRMLASHTSGLRDGKVYSTPPHVSLKEFFLPDGEYYENGGHFSPVDEPPADFFCYCNLNYGLLGTIIEIVTKERFDIYQREHILKQLHISGDYLPNNLSENAKARLGNIYRKMSKDGTWNYNDEWHIAINDKATALLPPDTVVLQNPYAEEINGIYSLKDYIPGTNATSFAPQGGLRLSLKDMCNVIDMILNKGMFYGKRILATKSIDEIFKTQWRYNIDKPNGDTCAGTLLSYGLGEYYIKGDSSARFFPNENISLFGHTGQAFGLLSGIFYHFPTKTAFAYIMNGEAVSEESNEAQGLFSGNFRWEEIVGEIVENKLIHGGI